MMISKKGKKWQTVRQETIVYSMTSLSKMDGDFFRSVDFGPISEVLEMIDPEIGLVLEQLAERSRDEVTDELIRAYDQGLLLQARVSIFRSAMDKVDWCLSHVAKARALETFVPSVDEERLIAEANKLFKKLSPKDLINRKCPRRTVNDIIDLLGYIGGDKIEFPIAMLRTKGPGSSRKPHGGMSPTELRCLQHISEFTSHGECDTDIADNPVVSNVMSKIITSNLEHSSVHEIERNVRAADQPETYVMEGRGGPSRERVPSRMFGYGSASIIEDISIQGENRISVGHSSINSHGDDSIVMACSSEKEERVNVHTMQLNTPICALKGSCECCEVFEVPTCARSPNVACEMNAADVHMSTIACDANKVDEQLPHPSVIPNQSAPFDIVESGVVSEFACQEGDRGLKAPATGGTSSVGATSQSASNLGNPLPPSASIHVQIGDKSVSFDIVALLDMASRFPSDDPKRSDKMGNAARYRRECHECDRKII